MIRRALRIGLRVGLLLGITFAVVKTVQARRASSSGAPAEPWEPLVAPRPVDEVGEPIIEPSSPPDGAPTEATAPAAKKAAKAAKATKAAKKAVAKAAKAKATGGGDQVWVEPVGGVCPPSHPIKAKLSSLIYHLPGMVAYDRTRANRCYPDPQAAEADGFVRAKR